jgi:hypothetical protein
MAKLVDRRQPTLFPIVLLLVGASVSSAAAAQTASVGAPAAFGVSGRTTILVVHGVGAQIYECKAGAGGASWVFREPVASLVSDGRTIGVHYHGPTWQLDDGGAVKGKQSATAPGASSGDVALLKLDVVEHRGSGALSAAKLVLRLNTRGGVLKGVCPAVGDLRAEPYSADYAFLR